MEVLLDTSSPVELYWSPEGVEFCVEETWDFKKLVGKVFFFANICLSFGVVAVNNLKLKSCAFG